MGRRGIGAAKVVGGSIGWGLGEGLKNEGFISVVDIGLSMLVIFSALLTINGVSEALTGKRHTMFPHPVNE